MWGGSWQAEVPGSRRDGRGGTAQVLGQRPVLAPVDTTVQFVVDLDVFEFQALAAVRVLHDGVA